MIGCFGQFHPNTRMFHLTSGVKRRVPKNLGSSFCFRPFATGLLVPFWVPANRVAYSPGMGHQHTREHGGGRSCLHDSSAAPAPSRICDSPAAQDASRFAGTRLMKFFMGLKEWYRQSTSDEGKPSKSDHSGDHHKQEEADPQRAGFKAQASEDHPHPQAEHGGSEDKTVSCQQVCTTEPDIKHAEHNALAANTLLLAEIVDGYGQGENKLFANSHLGLSPRTCSYEWSRGHRPRHATDEQCHLKETVKSEGTANVGNRRHAARRLRKRMATMSSSSSHRTSTALTGAAMATLAPTTGALSGTASPTSGPTTPERTETATRTLASTTTALAETAGRTPSPRTRVSAKRGRSTGRKGTAKTTPKASSEEAGCAQGKGPTCSGLNQMQTGGREHGPRDECGRGCTEPVTLRNGQVMHCGRPCIEPQNHRTAGRHNVQ